MNKIEAVKKTLEIYAEASTPITQGFYQGLCIEAIKTIEKLEDALVAISKIEDGCRRRGIGYDAVVDRIAKTALGQI